MNPFHHVSEYIKGELTSCDRASFEKALKTDRDLQLEVDQQRSLYKVARSIDPDLKSFITAQQTKSKPREKPLPKRSKPSSGMWILWSFIILTLCLVIAFTIKNKDGATENKEPIMVIAENATITVPLDTIAEVATSKDSVIHSPVHPSPPPMAAKDVPRNNNTTSERDLFLVCKQYAQPVGRNLLADLYPQVMGKSTNSEVNLDNQKAILDSLTLLGENLSALEKMSLGYLLFLRKNYSKSIEYYEEVAFESTLYQFEANYMKLISMTASLPKDNPDLNRQFELVVEQGGRYAEFAIKLFEQL